MIPSNLKELSRRHFLSRSLGITGGAVAAAVMTSCDSLNGNDKYLQPYLSAIQFAKLD